MDDAKEPDLVDVTGKRTMERVPNDFEYRTGRAHRCFCKGADFSQYRSRIAIY
ncbi:hypothetical protein MMMB2_2028 [Mycobacterium marinum MB2]|nr:hypothetical protein MMMB2_2028 [Mycobacterium marinum MB2]